MINAFQTLSSIATAETIYTAAAVTFSNSKAQGLEHPQNACEVGMIATTFPPVDTSDGRSQSTLGRYSMFSFSSSMVPRPYSPVIPHSENSSITTQSSFCSS